MFWLKGSFACSSQCWRMFRDHGLSQELMTFPKWGALDLGMIKISKTRPQQMGQSRMLWLAFWLSEILFHPSMKGDTLFWLRVKKKKMMMMGRLATRSIGPIVSMIGPLEERRRLHLFRPRRCSMESSWSNVRLESLGRKRLICGVDDFV